MRMILLSALFAVGVGLAGARRRVGRRIGGGGLNFAAVEPLRTAALCGDYASTPARRCRCCHCERVCHFDG